MIASIKKILIPLLCILTIAGCTSSTQFTPVKPEYDELITNGNFFVFYQDTIPDYWIASDTQLVTQTAYNVGPDSLLNPYTSESIAIKPGVTPKSSYLYTTVHVPQSDEVFPFTLTLVAAASSDTGTFYIDVYNSSHVTRLTGPPINGIFWKQYIIVDSSLIANHADSMHVVISAGSATDTASNRMVVANSCSLIWTVPPAGYNY